jgi:hypothetical protein
VNSTSAGPRGHLFDKDIKSEKDIGKFVDAGYSIIDLASDGTIRMVQFSNGKNAAAPSPAGASNAVGTSKGA